MAIPFGTKRSPTYHKLGEDTDSPPRTRTKFNWPVVIPWIMASGLALFSGYLLWHQRGLKTSYGAYTTDLPAVRPLVSYEERVFTGKFAYNEETGMIYREVDPSQPQYAGVPSPDIDASWEELLRGEFPVLTDEEAAPYTPDLLKIPNTGEYHFEFDMLHSLHCLNAIRKLLDKEYYAHDLEAMHRFAQNTSHLPSDWHRIHIDHCLDQVRQSIMCHGDLTPAPLFSWKGVPLALAVGQSHTCRKWGPIREWMDSRNKEHAPLEEEG
ncbi:hypothetical protein BBP40_000943 [Aspergillus hancockii]|nr:hypothetical protein BBP40_000943 [Aspergillus hancockii]